MKFFLMMFVVLGAFTTTHAFADTGAATNCDKIVQDGPVKAADAKNPSKAAIVDNSKQKAD